MSDNILFNYNGRTVDVLSKKDVSFDFLDKSFRRFIPKGPSTIGLDFLIIGICVSIADRCLSRSESFDGWTRQICATFPVINYEKWICVKTAVSKLLSFLSGDEWNVNFSKRDVTEIERKFLSRKYVRKINCDFSRYNKISMLSGGLDSFVGSVDLLSDSIDNVLFVNLHNGGSSFEQDFLNVSNSLTSYFGIVKPEVTFRTFSFFVKNGIEDSTRARSFMFFTHAIALATCFKNVHTIIIPENGTISLNVPLTISRNGSCSTRTTHPFYLKLLNDLLIQMGLDLLFKNPYQFNTKGEMLINCKNPVFVRDNLILTMSCSHPTSGRWHAKIGKPTHCGYCLPCIIRLAAEMKTYGMIKTKVVNPSKKTKNNQSTLRCIKIKLASYMNKDLLLQIEANGPIESDIEKYKDLYVRSMNELDSYIKTL